MLDIERRLYEVVVIGPLEHGGYIFIRILDIRTDVGNGLVTFGIDDEKHNCILSKFACAIPMQDTLQLAPEISIQLLAIENHGSIAVHQGVRLGARLGIVAPREIPIERDDMKKRPTNGQKNPQSASK
jgi:sRNA-binding carbon storage regulator CsrA